MRKWCSKDKDHTTWKTIAETDTFIITVCTKCGKKETRIK